MKPAIDVLKDMVLADIVTRLSAVYDPLAIYLFGSKARGEAGPDSDYDLMVIVPDDSPPELRQSRLASECLWETGCAADELVRTKETFDSRSHLQASLPGTILREGRLLYAT